MPGALGKARGRHRPQVAGWSKQKRDDGGESTKPDQGWIQKSPTFYRATDPSIWIATVGCEKSLSTPRAGCKNVTSFHFLRGLDPQRRQQGRLQR